MNEEMSKRMDAILMDETQSTKKYWNMAKAAENEDMAYGLAEMAKDEYTHAKFVHDSMQEKGCKISEACGKSWQEVENIASEMF